VANPDLRSFLKKARQAGEVVEVSKPERLAEPLASKNREIFERASIPSL
jgi:hypothetical protein